MSRCPEDDESRSLPVDEGERVDCTEDGEKSPINLSTVVGVSVGSEARKERSYMVALSNATSTWDSSSLRSES